MNPFVLKGSSFWVSSRVLGSSYIPKMATKPRLWSSLRKKESLLFSTALKAATSSAAELVVRLFLFWGQSSSKSFLNLFQIRLCYGFNESFLNVASPGTDPLPPPPPSLKMRSFITPGGPLGSTVSFYHISLFWLLFCLRQSALCEQISFSFCFFLSINIHFICVAPCLPSEAPLLSHRCRFTCCRPFCSGMFNFGRDFFTRLSASTKGLNQYYLFMIA